MAVLLEQIRIRDKEVVKATNEARNKDENVLYLEE